MIGIKRRNTCGCFILVFIVSLIRLNHSSYLSLYEYAPRLLTNESSSNHTENNNKKLNIVLLYADDVSHCCSSLLSYHVCVCMNISCMCVHELTLSICLFKSGVTAHLEQWEMTTFRRLILMN